ncbi:MAG: glycolate oxidase subunit GlcD, partial [bacterium]
MESRLIDGLIGIVGKDGVLRTEEDLAAYSYDGTFAEGRPDVVVLPQSTEQVSRIVKLVSGARLPIVA